MRLMGLMGLMGWIWIALGGMGRPLSVWNEVGRCGGATHRISYQWLTRVRERECVCLRKEGNRTRKDILHIVWGEQRIRRCGSRHQGIQTTLLCGEAQW